MVREDQKLEKAYFFRLPYFSALKKEIKTQFNQNVNRLSCKTKCTDLQENSHEIINSMKREDYISKVVVVRHISKHMKLFRNTSYIFILIINGLILKSFKKKESQEDQYDDIIIDYLIPACGFIVVAFALVIVFYNFYHKTPVIMKAWQGVTFEKLNLFILADCVYRTIVNVL